MVSDDDIPTASRPHGPPTTPDAGVRRARRDAPRHGRAPTTARGRPARTISTFRLMPSDVPSSRSAIAASSTCGCAHTVAAVADSDTRRAGCRWRSCAAEPVELVPTPTLRRQRKSEAEKVLHVDRAEALHERRAASQSGAEIALAHEHRGTLGRAIVLAAERALPRRSRRGSIGGGGDLVAKPHSQRLQVGTCVCQAYLHTKLSAASVAASDERGLRSHMLRRRVHGGAL
mmetsp:Transcript_3978/g.13378  ORF Transcript_3978/g.13378 Transcript_3978/m.13378 type:complete len:231 (+) Transcript_3978:66-758(+)